MNENKNFLGTEPIGKLLLRLALPTVAAIPCIAVSTFICCFVTAKIISFIPGSKWIIG